MRQWSGYKMENRRLLQNLPQTPKPSLPVLILSKLLALALPIAQLVLGGLYLQQCPVQPLIPVYLLVSGAFALSLALLSCLPCTQENESGGGAVSTMCTAWNSIVTLFLFCWFIAGNVWVYSIYEPNYDPNKDQYCNKTLYLFTFWTITFVYIVFGVLMIVGCFITFCLCLFGGSRIAEQSPNGV